jgi:hypothetical protein
MGLLSSSMHRVIVGKLGNSQPFFPVILTMVNKDAQILFKGLILAFRLTIYLEVVSSGGIVGGTNRAG